MNTAETIQDAMHKAGLKTYQALQEELEQSQRDVKRLELHLDIENANKKFAYKYADKQEWRAKLWRTIALSTLAAVVVWRLWVAFF